MMNLAQQGLAAWHQSRSLDLMRIAKPNSNYPTAASASSKQLEGIQMVIGPGTSVIISVWL